jgi:fibronectin type 3 domain-containing protein
LRKLSAPTVSASDNTSTSSITVSWGAVTGATSYTLQKSTASGGPYSDLTTITTTSYTDTAVSAGMLYYYRVFAKVGAYPSDYSAYNAGIRKLLAPGSVAATDSTSTSYVTVTWSAVTGATNYYVGRSTSSTGTYTDIGSSATTSYNDTSATPGTVYYYKVHAYSNGYYSDYSAYNSGLRKLATPGSISATDNTSTSYTTVSWGAVTGATSYYVDRSTTYNGTYINLGTSASTSYNDATATPGTFYYYKVRAYASGYYSDISTYDWGLRKIAAPTNISATDGTLTTGVTITWSAPTGGSSYYMYRYNSSTGIYDYIGNVSSIYTMVSYTDTAVTSTSTQYYYRITPFGSAGTSYPGVQSTYDTGYRGMAAPTGVSATDGTGNGSGGNYVRITWNAVSGATGYSVYYSTAYNGTYILAANTTALYYDYAPPVAYGTVLYYKVRAYTSSSYPGAYSAYNSGYRWNITSGLTGHWTFDNTWTDYGTANGLYDHFTKATVGSPILSTGRIVGTHSVQVTGDDMKTSTGHTFMSTDRKSMSVAFWVYRREDYASTNYFMMCTDFGIFQTSTNYIGLATWISSGSTNSAKYPISKNLWTHIVATYDGTYIRLYVNGEPRATTTHAGTISSSYTRYLTLGGFTSPSWNGNIDDLRIYNRVLATSEITGLYGWR